MRTISAFHYAPTEQIYIKALEIAKTEHASYFVTAKSVGIEGQIKGIRILGAHHECVLFLNKSSIIIEESLPLYCFKNRSLELSQEL